MIKFKVYAGNMFCGHLTVLPGLSHNFLSKNWQIICESNAIKKIASYKKLKLVRI